MKTNHIKLPRTYIKSPYYPQSGVKDARQPHELQDGRFDSSLCDIPRGLDRFCAKGHYCQRCQYNLDCGRRGNESKL